MAFVVHLDDDYRLGEHEAATQLIQAIRLLRGVATVEPLVTTSEDHMARIRVRQEFEERLFTALRDADGR